MKIGSKARGLPSSDFGLWIADFRFAGFVGRFCETPSCLAGIWHKTPYKRMRQFVKYWLPLLIWLGVIFVGSTSVMSAEHTSPIHRSLLALVETRHVAKGNFD